jgi:hypothetical protein
LEFSNLVLDIYKNPQRNTRIGIMNMSKLIKYLTIASMSMVMCSNVHTVFGYRVSKDLQQNGVGHQSFQGKTLGLNPVAPGNLPQNPIPRGTVTSAPGIFQSGRPFSPDKILALFFSEKSPIPTPVPQGAVASVSVKAKLGLIPSHVSQGTVASAPVEANNAGRQNSSHDWNPSPKSTPQWTSANVSTNLNQNLQQSGSQTGSISQNIAIAFLTDLHCNESQYPMILKAIEDLCRQHGTVVVCINGDFVTQITKEGNFWNVVPTNGNISIHRNRANLFLNFCFSLLTNKGVQLVINLGNHEFMHPEEAIFVLGELIKGGRTYVVSNAPLGRGPEGKKSFAELVKPSVVIGDITFVGYCTNDIIHGKSNDLRNYVLAKKQGYLVDDSSHGWWQRHNTRFERSIQNVKTSILVVLSHETREISDKFVWPMISKCCPHSVRNKFIAIGHDHFDFRPKTNSSRSFGDFAGGSVPNTNNSHFKGADRVFCIPPFGCGIGILELPSKSCTTKRLTPL